MWFTSLHMFLLKLEKAHTQKHNTKLEHIDSGKSLFLMLQRVFKTKG